MQLMAFCVWLCGTRDADFLSVQVSLAVYSLSLLEAMAQNTPRWEGAFPAYS